MKPDPLRSTMLPTRGADSAARIPPSDTAPDISVRVQPSSSVIGETKTDRVPTAPPCFT